MRTPRPLPAAALTAVTLLVALVATAAAPRGAALAQATAPAVTASDLKEVEDGQAQVPGLGVNAARLEEMEVVGAGGEELGTVEEVLANPAGQIVAVTVESGGFLGIGAKEVVVQLDQLRLTDDRLSTSLSKEQLAALPAWADD
jgi:sporulation protein YlmC with PRC-barrel domain